jgi:protein-disulfide isomerase
MGLLEAGQRDDADRLMKRLEGIDEAIGSLDKKVAELSTLIRAARPPAPVTDVPPFDLDISGSAVKGSAAASVAIVEFSDFECPFCGRHAQTAYRELERQFVNRGEIRYVFRHLPLEHLHPSALKAAEGAECAREQDRFWEMHDRLFANQKALAVQDLNIHAQTLELDVARFQSCVTDGRMTAKVKDDLAEAQRLGLTATPSFLLGEVTSTGVVRVRKKIIGTQPFPVFQAALEGIVAKQANQK